jgi:hypothetical protein
MRIIRRIVPMLICDPWENDMNCSETNREAVRLVQQQLVNPGDINESPPAVQTCASVDLVSVRLRT